MRLDLNRILPTGQSKKYISGVLALLALIGLIGCASSYPGDTRIYYTSRYSRGKRRGVTHVVGTGETLWRIAKAYNIRLEYLAKVNGIRNFRDIKIGRKIFIPGAKKVLKIVPAKPDSQRIAVRHKASTRRSGTTNKPVANNRFQKTAAAKVKSLIWPADGRMTSPFGLRWGSKHEGIDIAVPMGTEIKAVAPGKVIYSDNKMRYYGNVVILKHEGGYFSIYAHNSVNLVKAGTMVNQGDIIAKVGQSGRATGPHLHFEIRKGDKPINPLRYLPSR